MEFGWVHVLTIVGANIVLIMGMVGTYIALYMHTDRKTDPNRVENRELLKAINDEMKDFHARLIAIEERNKSKIL